MWFDTVTNAEILCAEHLQSFGTMWFDTVTNVSMNV